MYKQIANTKSNRNQQLRCIFHVWSDIAKEAIDIYQF